MNVHPDFAIRSGWTAACLALLVAVASASHPQTIQSGHTSPPTPAHPSVTAVVHLDKSTYNIAAHPNARMHAVMRLTNRTASTITLNESGRQYDWQVLDDKGKVVWNYATGKHFPHFRMLRLLNPGASIDYPVEVPLQDDQGRPLAPGHYRLHGRLLNGTSAEASAAFTVDGAAHQPRTVAPTLQPRTAEPTLVPHRRRS